MPNSPDSKPKTIHSVPGWRFLSILLLSTLSAACATRPLPIPCQPDRILIREIHLPELPPTATNLDLLDLLRAITHDLTIDNTRKREIHAQLDSCLAR